MSSTQLSTSSITNLPNEVLDKIFRTLNNIDLAKCCMVTKYWREHIHTKLGLDLKIGIPLNTQTRQRRVCTKMIRRRRQGNNFQNVKMQYISKYGSRFCWFGGEIPNDTNTLHTFKYWYLVKRLIFDGKLPLQTMNNILDPLGNLANLTLGQFTLLHLRIKDVHLTFPQLQTLIISGHNLRTSMEQSSRPLSIKKTLANKTLWRQMIMNVVYLLKRTNSPSIGEIVLQGLQVQSSMQADVILEALWQFIVKHKYTLEKLSILVSQAGLYVNSRLQTTLDPDQLATDMVDLRLKSIFVQNSRQLSNSKRMQELLGVMLQSQDSNALKHLIWSFDPTKEVIRIPFPGKLVLSNQTSLVSIEMTLSRTLDRINCKSFMNCESLKSLTLTSESGIFLNDANELIALPMKLELTSLDHLPPNLKSFRIDGLDIEMIEAHALTELNLEVLELKNIGCTGSLGLGPNSFVHILNRKVIKLIRLVRAVNTTSLVTVEATVQLAINSMLNKFHNASPLAVGLRLVDNVYKSCYIKYEFERKECGCYEFHGDGSKYFKNMVSPSLFGIRGQFKIIPLDDIKQCRQPRPARERIVEENLDYSDSDTEGTTSDEDEEDEDETESDSNESKSKSKDERTDSDKGSKSDSSEVSSEESSEEADTPDSEEDSSEDADSDSD